MAIFEKYEKAVLAHTPMKVKDLLDGLEKADAKRIRYHIDKQPAPNVYAGWGNMLASTASAWGQQLQQQIMQPSPLVTYVTNTPTFYGSTTTSTSGMLGNIGRTF